MEHKRLTLFAGHYGSGKTNIAVNYALHLAGEGKKVCIADLDIVNPYFRTKDSAKELEAAGVDLISPQYANSNVDLPALPAQSYRLVQDKSVYNYRMVFVANCCRPLTRTAEDALEIMREIEAACGLNFTCIVNNSNLGPETTAGTVLDSVDFIEKLSKLSGLPVWLHTAEERVASQLTDMEVLPLRLQEKYFDLPTTGL